VSYDERLAERVRSVLGERARASERKMFGGLAFLVAGHMACGIVGKDLMVRVGPERYEKALARRHVRPMDFTGRPLRGMVYVEPAGLRSRAALSRWIAPALEFVRSLPPSRRGGIPGGRSQAM
jgi:TfoX/Sxy family transcriptional regulator of competence genes